ncbi:MAG: hypothetical protein DHS20C21_19190 [Gemmatimonadota bacterium]|nr:MAG: hypothetical protein DHS20C21_19190 [Gemmatimonadota bacterium]
MRIHRMLWLLAAAIGLGTWTAPTALASRVDTWEGLFIRGDVSDTNVFPHLMIDYEGSMYLIYAEAPGAGAGTRIAEQDEQRFMAGVVASLWGDADSEQELVGGCSIGDRRSYNPIASYNNPHTRRPAAALRNGSDFRQNAGIGLSSTLEPQDRFQASLAYRFSDRLSLGVAYAQGSNESTVETDPLLSAPTTTFGSTIDYTTFTASLEYDLGLPYLQSIQYGGSFTSGTHEERENGKGDNGGYAGNLRANLGEINGWDTSLQVGVHQMNSDYTFDVPDDFTGTIPQFDSKDCGWNLDFGGTFDVGRNSNISATAGVASTISRFVDTADPFFDKVITSTQSDIVPTCGVAGSIGLSDRWTVDLGATGAFDQSQRSVSRETADDHEIVTTWEEVANMRYRVGLFYERPIGTDHNGDGEGDGSFGVSATFDPDALTQNPIRGDASASNDAWLSNVAVTYTFD